MSKKVNEEQKILNENPFLAGRTEAADRYGHLAKNAAQWRRISLGLFILCIICVVVIIQMSATRTVVPFIVQVDRHGFEIAIAPVQASAIDDRLIIARIARYVTSLKTVYIDNTAQISLMQFVYNSTPAASGAERRFLEFYQLNNPMEISRTRTVHVDVHSVLPLGGSQWQADWTTRIYTRLGTHVRNVNYRGVFDIAVDSPTSMVEVMANPLGIFITNFVFSEIVI